MTDLLASDGRDSGEPDFAARVRQRFQEAAAHPMWRDYIREAEENPDDRERGSMSSKELVIGALVFLALLMTSPPLRALALQALRWVGGYPDP